MSEPEFVQIAFMPYAPIESGFKIGDYEMWPYYEERTERIDNPAVREHLDSLFGRYFEYTFDRKTGGYDRPLEQVFMVSPAGFRIGSSKFSDKQIDDIQAVKNAVAFCAITDSGFFNASSDGFVLYFQNFRIGSESITIQHKHFTKLSMVKFMKPYYIDRPVFKFQKTDLCDSLGKALKFKSNPHIVRIFRALDMFCHATTQNESVTHEHRLLSLLMCFEILLNFRDKQQFVKKIRNLLEDHHPQMQTRTVRIKEKDIKVSLSSTCWWAYDLYNLRSNIIHGKEITLSDWQFEKYGTVHTRTRFAGIVLRRLIKKMLRRESLWGPDECDLLLEGKSLDETLDEMMNRFREDHGRAL